MPFSLFVIEVFEGSSECNFEEYMFLFRFCVLVWDSVGGVKEGYAECTVCVCVRICTVWETWLALWRVRGPMKMPVCVCVCVCLAGWSRAAVASSATQMDLSSVGQSQTHLSGTVLHSVCLPIQKNSPVVRLQICGFPSQHTSLSLPDRPSLSPLNLFPL